MTKTRKPDTGVISLADEHAVRDAVWASIQGLWEVVNTLTRLRPSTRERYRVTIFGSARVEPDTFAYDETKRAARMLARDGLRHHHGGRPRPDAGRQRRRVRRIGPQSFLRHPRGAPLRTGRQRVCHAGLRAPDVLHAASPVRPGLRCIHRDSRRHWHGAGDDADLAAAASPAPAGHPADPGGHDVAWPDRVGAVVDAGGPSAAGQSRGHEDPGVRGQRRPGHSAHPQAPQQVAGRPRATDPARRPRSR